MLQFYLAFENSLCGDYITEKFWKVLSYNVVPVVLNGVNMTRVAPPHSYIDIKDFASVEGDTIITDQTHRCSIIVSAACSELQIFMESCT